VLKRLRSSAAGELTREFDRLTFATRIDFPTPEPIALDEAGRWFGTPALVMSKVDGAPRLHDRRGSWIDSLADALVRVHGTSVPAEVPEVLQARHAGLTIDPAVAEHLRPSARVERLRAVTVAMRKQVARTPGPRALLHHDYHHGNVTWERGRAAAIIDWNEARLGPVSLDVSYCSVDLAMTHGIRAAEQFTDRYEIVAGAVPDLRRWQAMWVLSDMRWVSYWLTGFQDLGAAHLGLPTLRRRLRAFADHVLERC